MRASSPAFRNRNIEITRTAVQEDEQLFGDVLKEIAEKLWPENTAASLAAEAGCSERAVEYYFSGGRDWSGDAITALVAEILKRHKMRNVKIVKR